MEYYSQYGQDKFVDKVLKYKIGGFFVDIGAHDGIAFSNSLFFEKYRNWTGICIEPNPVVFNKLKENRSAHNIRSCIGNREGLVKFMQIEGHSEMLSGIADSYDPRHLERIQSELKSHGGKMQEIEVPIKKLKDILESDNIVKVDYCSIDVEGAELEILESIDFKSAVIDIFTIENNYKDNRIKLFMAKHRYGLIKKLKGEYVFRLNKKKYWLF